MEQKRPRWVDKPEFEWTPDAPLKAEPQKPAPPQPIVPQFPDPAPLFVPANDAVSHSGGVQAMRGLFRSLASAVLGWIIVRAWRLEKLFAGLGSRFALPAIAPRLAIGLGQGLALSGLFTMRDQTVGAESLLAALIMAATFAPLLLVQGLGRIPARTLAIWVGGAAVGLALLGVYHHWRIGAADAGHAGLWTALLVSIFLFIGQALLLGHARNAPGPLRYAVLYEASWRLAAEAILCGVFALAVWSLWNLAETSLVQRDLYPLFSRLGIVLATSSFALAAQLRTGPMLHVMKRGAVIALTASFPVLILAASATLLVGFFGRWQPPFALCAVEGLGLLLAINASYRGGEEWRPQWRRRAEFASAFLLLPLAVFAGLALQARVAQFGFTAPRVIAMAALFLLAAYALVYAGAALISLGGGRWMERIETVNLAMAFVVLSLAGILMSPMGDPVRLAVAEQAWRASRTAPEKFDYAYLHRSGLRFGDSALNAMARDARNPAVARNAFVALESGPSAERALPSEIGANIHVMTPGGLLPSTLLTQDWNQAGKDVPPCLTTARLSCDAYFVDLDRDGLHEIILTYGDDASWWGAVMRQTDQGWALAGTISPPPHSGTLSALRAGAFTLADPLPGWRDLIVNGKRLAVSPIPHAAPAQGARP